MSIWRGMQSAIFYYVSCTPILDARYRKRREKEARRDALSRHEWKTVHPDYPDQVAPNSINPFWQAEIDAGPRIDPNKLNQIKEKRKQRLEDLGGSTRGLRTSATQTSVGSSGQGLEDTRLGALNENTSGGHRWNHRIYQRRDEELWGVNCEPGRSSPTLHGVTSRPSTARTAASTAPKSYLPDRHPSINDMHPPTTRKIAHPEAIAWMFQPLPTAEVMAGKEPPGRSRANSDLSRSRATSVRRKVSPTPVKIVHQESEETIQTVVQTPESEQWMPESDGVVEFAYEHTRREVTQRHSLEW